MGTVSTVPAVKAQIVSKLTTALATSSLTGGQVQVSWAWPGPEAEWESVFLGRHPGLGEVRVDVDHDLPTLKAGRQPRQEAYEVPITVWAFRPSNTADDARTAEERAFTLAQKVEDLFADEPNIGLSGIHSAQVDRLQSTLFPFEKGWGCELVVFASVSARLT